ncbi:ser-thr-rich glycosyl-phosphatidyl-inositol-anchored membrane family [Pyrrhoderma noxium]|uniref:Ser-thr-rich glycosyl-phosphatidyl-inositol-anchored membrane family n=1 Tax=Pyrrhoderma noxium TaxID=2282107 RepID=A0A286UI17_9AGAM|nr:ser-thr-rich glycosyl-phosphatidyl-inositol-anchored membrane family [Pyrrhoderma noxium]
MKYILSIATLLFAGTVTAQTPLVVNTPANAVQCEPVLLTWSGDSAPFLAVRFSVHILPLPGNDIEGAPLVDLGEQEGNSVIWEVNVPAGTSVDFVIKDSSGTEAFSAPFTIQPSDDSSCLALRN